MLENAESISRAAFLSSRYRYLYKLRSNLVCTHCHSASEHGLQIPGCIRSREFKLSVVRKGRQVRSNGCIEYVTCMPTNHIDFTVFYSAHSGYRDVFLSPKVKNSYKIVSKDYLLLKE